MSVRLSVSECGQVLNPAALDYDRGVTARRAEDLTLREKVAVLEQMLSMLGTMTVAGQRHTMIKIAALIQQEARNAAGQLGERKVRKLLELATTLGRDAEMAIPHVDAFMGRAKNAFALLAG